MTVNVVVLPATWVCDTANQRLISLYDEAAAGYRKAIVEATRPVEKYLAFTASEHLAIAKMNLKLCEDQIRRLDLQLKEQGEK